MTGYITVNHMMLNEFVERWHSETSSFHLPHGEMSIAFDDVSCFLYLLIMGRFLDHGRMIKDEALDMMVECLRTDPGEATNGLDKTRGAHVTFVYLKKVYEDVLLSAQLDDGDDENMALHKSHSLEHTRFIWLAL